MKYEKLSAKDWMSSKLRINVIYKPKSYDRVDAKCLICSKIVNIIFSELIRSTNRHLLLGLYGYHCSVCLRNSKQYRDNCRRNSKNAADKIKIGASARSKKLWENKQYRQKMLANHRNLSVSLKFKEKTSLSIKEKFKDIEYIKKIKSARKKYWNNETYRSIKTWSLEQFITIANKTHNNKYCYDLVEYKNIKSKVIIICSKHGLFTQRPSHHVFYKNGCPKCSLEIETSTAQQEIADWLISFGYNIVLNDRNKLKGLELDILIPNCNLAIEYHGSYWHSFNSAESESQKLKHFRKANVADDNNIRLFQLFDTEWNNRKELVKSVVLRELGNVEYINTKNCVVIQLDDKLADKFCINNCINDNKRGNLHYGLKINNKLVSVVSFLKFDGFFEITRFCDIMGAIVVGGLLKLLMSFEISKFVVYVDRRYPTDLYSDVGFKQVSIIKPNYWYWKNNKTFDCVLSVSENMFCGGYRRIWDAGYIKLVLDLSKLRML